MIEKDKYIDSLKQNIDELREHKLSSSASIKQYEGELNRTKQRYRDLYDYTEKQKNRLDEYKKAISELQSFESKEKQKLFETQKYFRENEELKDKIKIVKHEMKCVQNACMHLLKRQALIDNNLLSTQSKNQHSTSSSTATVDKLNQFNSLKSADSQKQVQKLTTFSFRR